MRWLCCSYGPEVDLFCRSTLAEALAWSDSCSGRGPLMKIVWLVLGLSAALGGCVRPHGETPSATVTVAPSLGGPPAASVPSGRRIVYDGAGAFILPDGTTVEADAEGGFALPNGAYAQPDRAGGVTLPNGTRCGPDGARGYVCP